MADPDPLPDPLPRVERLRVEGMKLRCDNATMPKDSPALIQQPVILEADRLSPSPVPNEETPSPFQECQIDPLLKIFEYLTLKERVKLSLTCRRFHTVLTDKNASPMRGLTVLNMFQKKVWVKSVKNNAISSLTQINIAKMEYIVALLKHVKRIDCLKIWYQDEEFVNMVLNAFDPSILVRNVDVYPYGSEIALDKVAEKFPRVNAMTMRPHGSAHFYKGIRISSMPNFEHLNILSMDSFEPRNGFSFPSSIRNLDFGHRKLNSMAYLFDAIGQLNLTYLGLSHLKFNDESSMEDLIYALSKMKRLEVLVLKFCHLSNHLINASKNLAREKVFETVHDTEWRSQANPKKELTLSLKTVHFDLCYEVSTWSMYSLTVLSRNTIKNFSVSLLYEDEVHFSSLLALTPVFNGLNMGISFSVMQKDNNKPELIKPHPKIPAEFHHVLSRFEASYLVKPELLMDVFGKLCKNLQECKFVSVPGLNDAVLELISVNCPNLKKLSIISCGDTSEEGLIFFATNISQRTTSAPLKILFKTNRQSAAIISVYGELSLRSTRDHSLHYTTKTFNEIENAGECLLFKDKTLNRTVVFKNYTPEDSNHLLGLVIDIEEELELVDNDNWSKSFKTLFDDQKSSSDNKNSPVCK